MSEGNKTPSGSLHVVVGCDWTNCPKPVQWESLGKYRWHRYCREHAEEMQALEQRKGWCYEWRRLVKAANAKLTDAGGKERKESRE